MIIINIFSQGKRKRAMEALKIKALGALFLLSSSLVTLAAAAQLDPLPAVLPDQ